MAYQLSEEVVHHAPDLPATEFRILATVAERARVETRECVITRVHLARLIRKSEHATKRAMARLAGMGLGVRVPIGKDKNGEPFYGVPGQSLTLRLPRLRAPDDCRCGPCADAAQGVPNGDPLDDKGSRTVPEGVPNGPGRGPHSGPPSRSRGSVAAARVSDELPNDHAAVVALVIGKTGCTPAQAAQFVAESVAGQVRSPLSWVRGIPPEDLTRKLAALPPPPRPPLRPVCGHCEARDDDPPSARWRVDEHGHRAKCWECHPGAQPDEGAA